MSSSSVAPSAHATGTAPSTASSTSTGSAPSSTKFRGFNVPSLLAWTDPVKTGTIAGEAFLAWVVLSSSLALRIFLRLNAYFLFLIGVLEFSTRLINGKDNGLIGSYRPSRFLPREQAIQNISASIAKNVRSALYGIEHLLDTRNPGLNLSLAFGSYVLYKVLGWISIRNLALVVIVTVFTLPAAYLQFKPQVDEAITALQAHLSSHQAKLEKIAHDKAGNQINFVKKFTNNSSRGGFPSASASASGTAPAGTSASASTGSASTGSASTGHSTGASTGASGLGSTSSHTAPSTSSTAPLSTAGHSTAPLTGTSHSASTTHSTAPLSTESVLNSYSEVPSLAGNVKLDQQKVNDFQTDAQSLRDSIQKDKSY